MLVSELAGNVRSAGTDDDVCIVRRPRIGVVLCQDPSAHGAVLVVLAHIVSQPSGHRRLPLLRQLRKRDDPGARRNIKKPCSSLLLRLARGWLLPASLYLFQVRPVNAGDDRRGVPLHCNDIAILVGVDGSQRAGGGQHGRGVCWKALIAHASRPPARWALAQLEGVLPVFDAAGPAYLLGRGGACLKGRNSLAAGLLY